MRRTASPKSRGRPIEGDWPYVWLDATYVKGAGRPHRLNSRRHRHPHQRRRRAQGCTTQSLVGPKKSLANYQVCCTHYVDLHRLPERRMGLVVGGRDEGLCGETAMTVALMNTVIAAIDYAPPPSLDIHF